MFFYLQINVFNIYGVDYSSQKLNKTDLGITVTNDLKSSQQCLLAFNKANKILGVINRSVVYKKKDVLVKLYKSLVRRHLEYCTAGWSFYYSKHKDILERIQHRFTRMVPGLKSLRYEQRLIKLRYIYGDWKKDEYVQTRLKFIKL